ncbi:MAG: hypothetical protein HY985_07290, partial [Magnetospirillum sp.]|nr:hypothetical protein [Magnetospirillum sp.]
MAALPPVATVGAPGTTLASAETAIFPPPVEVIEVPGTPSADVLIGTGKPEHMQGFRGDDVLYGGAGDDSLDGGIGTDRLEGGPGNDSYDGGPGRDLLSFALEQAPALVDLQNSQVTVSGTFEFTQNVEDLTGSAFGDTLMGDAEDNVLVGGGGLDLLAGRLGNDTLDGGADGAYASWSDLGGPVAADLAAGIATEWDGGTDTLSGIVGAVGTRFDDTLAGDDDANRLEGGAGADRLDGRGGDDVLAGGSGADPLDGGGGVDAADY